MLKNSRRSFCAGLAGTALMAQKVLADVIHAMPDRSLKIANDDAVRQLLRQRIDIEKRAVGMAVCIVTPDRRRIITWGRERLSDDQMVTADTLFEIGSITKVFTSLLLADMARRGELGLDDPVTRHLPSDFRLPQLNGRPITLADLSTHTSGLPRFPEFPGKPLSPEWKDAIPRFTTQEFKAWLANLHPDPPPPSAAGWWYSNAGYTLLSIALAYRGGRSYEALLHERVIEPAGLRHTAYPTAAMKTRLAECHDSDLKPIPPTELGILIGGGGLVSTPTDLSRFATEILSGSGSVAKDNEILLTVQRPAPWIGGKQALGWEVRNAPEGAFVTKDGVTWGHATSMVFDPDSRTAVIVFSNTAPDMRNSTLSGGGVGAADLAQHLLRPSIPLNAEGATHY
jgi:serine-type D-Ala-D-Ala carboxypeptidase/endopeptidase